VLVYETAKTAESIGTTFKEKKSQEIECPAGDTAVGGGVQWVTGKVGVGSVVAASAPVKTSKGWRAEMIQTFAAGSKASSGEFKAWVVCSHP
jgi:hypothetical protein